MYEHIFIIVTNCVTYEQLYYISVTHEKITLVFEINKSLHKTSVI